MSEGNNGQGTKTPASLVTPKKGFRQAPQPTKNEVMEENFELAKNLEGRIEKLTQGIGNAFMQLSQQMNNMRPEVDAMSTLEASTILGSEGIIQKGDHVMMDYLGSLSNDDGTTETDENGLPKYFDGGFGTTFVLQNLGSGKLIPGFEDQLLGKRTGETFEIDVQFPEGYGAKELSNRKAKFMVHIHRIYRTVEESLVLKTKRAYEFQKAKLRAAAEEARKTQVLERSTVEGTIEASSEEEALEKLEAQYDTAQPTEITQESPAETQEGTANEQNNI